MLSHYSIRAFKSQKTPMDHHAMASVFSHLIKPFLSRNDRSGTGFHLKHIFFKWWDVLSLKTCIFDCFFADPGCRSSSPSSTRWVQDNLGSFSGFATVQDLQDLNPDISIVRIECRWRGHSALNISQCVDSYSSLIKQWSPLFRVRHCLRWPLLR